MAEGCGAGMSKIVLFIINVLVWVASIILIAIGGYVLNNSAQYNNLFGEGSNTLGVVCGVIIAVGCFIFLVGFLGCCGACMENGLALKLYFTVLLVLVLVEFIGGILAFVYRNEIKDFIQTELGVQVRENYGSPDQKVVTQAIDDLQQKEQCCGVINYTDYQNSTFAGFFPDEAVPKSCCKKETQVDCNRKNSKGDIRDVKNIYTNGCMTKLVKIFEDNFVYIGVAALVLILVEVTAMIMACCLVRGISKGDYKSYA